MILGNSTPRIQTTPLAHPTRGNEVAEFAEQIGMPLLPWQQYLIDEASKTKPDHTWVMRDLEKAKEAS